MLKYKIQLNSLKILFLSLLLCIGSLSYAALPKILLVAAETNTTRVLDVKTKLTATGMFSVVDLYYTNLATPDITTLKQYNAVFVWTQNDPDNYILLGDNLAAYIENGGGVVDAVFENASMPVLGNFDSSAYRCLVPLGQTSGSVSTMDTILLPGHPVMKNILSFNAGSNSFISTSDSTAPGSYVIAKYDNDAIFIAARENVGSAKVRRVSLNFYPPSSDARVDFWDKNTDGALIMANALTWVSNLHNNLPKVLVAGTPSNSYWLVDVKNKLFSTGMFSEIDTINLTTNTPSLNAMKQYMAIFVFGDQEYEDTALLGNNLASYIDYGGAVVDAQFELSKYYEIGGRFKTLEYQCLLAAPEASSSVRTLGTIEKSGHALMTSVGSFNGGSKSYHSSSQLLAPDAYVVARYDNNDILIAARENVGIKNARRVSVNFYPPSSDVRVDLWDVATDGAKIMANALIWAINKSNSLNFDGTNDYISTEINPNEAAPFTYIASVYPTTAIGEKMIFGTCTRSDIWDGMWLEVDGSYLRFYADGTILSNNIVPINQWSDVAVSYDSTIVRLYINGLLQAEAVKDMTAIDGGNLHIGAIGTAYFNNYMFNGNLDNISIWNKALTSADILKFQNRKLTGSEPGLITYYDFNQGIAGGNNPDDTILFDLKSATNNGLLHNFALTGETSNWVGSIAYSSNNVPSIQATNITFGEISGDQIPVSWTRGNGEKCAVFVKNASTGTAFPIFGTTYTADSLFGNGMQIESSGWYCVYNGTGNSMTLMNFVPGETYIVHVCEYAGTSGNEDYNTSADVNNPVVKSIITSVNETSIVPKISVFPNPVTDNLTIVSSGTEALHYYLYEISGKLILSGTLNGNNLDLSRLNSGMYILDINQSNKFKIIKQ
jgi:hypothetical protein